MESMPKPTDSPEATELPPKEEVASAISPGSTDSDTQSEVSTRFSPGTGRRMAALFVFIAVVLAGVYLASRRPRLLLQKELARAAKEMSERPPIVTVVHPVVASEIAQLTLPAEARAYFDTTVYARTNGYLKAWHVDIGDHVKAGQLLATIETPELDEQLTEQKAKIVALQADVQLAEAQRDFATLTARRWEAAAPEGAVSQQERDEKIAQSNNAGARLAAAKAQLDLGRAVLKRLESEASFQHVIAPFDGVITQRYIDMGSLITAGSTSNNTPLFVVTQTDRIRVFTKVPQISAPFIKPGMSASITVRECPGHVFQGKVDRTSESVDPNTRTVKVQVLVPNPDFLLLPGMYVQASFETVREHPPLIIHASALNLTAQGPKVAVVDEQNRVQFRDIRISRDLGDTVEVSEGLRRRDWIALNISEEITDGEKVQPAPLAVPTLKVAALSAAPKGTEGLNHAHRHSTDAVGGRRSETSAN